MGQKYESADGDNQFGGELSQVNVYSYTLSSLVVYDMANNCSTGRVSGNVYNWVVLDTYVEHDVEIVRPALCGRSQCPAGYRGTYCDIKIGENIGCTSGYLVTYCDIKIGENIGCTSGYLVTYCDINR